MIQAVILLIFHRLLDTLPLERRLVKGYENAGSKHIEDIEKARGALMVYDKGTYKPMSRTKV